MLKKAKKTVRKRTAKKSAVKKTPRKAAARRKKTSTLKRIESALEVGVAELDDMAVSLGLLGAVEPAAKKRKAKR